MPRYTLGLLRYAFLISVTAVAVSVMLWASSRNDVTSQAASIAPAPVPPVAQQRYRVAVQPLKVETVDVTATFSGKFHPWETYQLAFEVPGRVETLGTTADGKPLDDGDRVSAGQVLARLDPRIFNARRSEASAQLEEAASDMQRFREMRKRTPGAITDSEYQEQLTKLALTRAQRDIAEKNLEDSVLVAPVEATISQRMIKTGESIAAHQVAFELVQNQELLLIVDVPESQIRELELRRREVQQQSHDGGPQLTDDDRTFRAFVRLQGRDRFGNRPEPIEAEVYRIAQVADERTGLFKVEVRVPNPDGALRAGMVAIAEIVTQRLRGYRIPDTAVMFRDREAFLFTVDEQQAPLQVMFWEVDQIPLQNARKIPLRRWVEQGAEIIVPAEEQTLSSVVTRGQERLADGQLVRIVRDQGSEGHDSPPDITLPPAPLSARQDAARNPRIP